MVLDVLDGFRLTNHDKPTGRTTQSMKKIRSKYAHHVARSNMTKQYQTVMVWRGSDRLAKTSWSSIILEVLQYIAITLFT